MITENDWKKFLDQNKANLPYFYLKGSAVPKGLPGLPLVVSCKAIQTKEMHLQDFFKKVSNL